MSIAENVVPYVYKEHSYSGKQYTDHSYSNLEGRLLLREISDNVATTSHEQQPMPSTSAAGKMLLFIIPKLFIIFLRQSCLVS